MRSCPRVSSVWLQQIRSWAASAGEIVTGPRCDHPTLLCTQSALQAVCIVAALTIQEDCGQTAEGPKRSHGDYQRGAGPALCGRSDRVTTFLPGYKKAQGGFITIFQCLECSCKVDGVSVSSTWKGEGLTSTSCTKRCFILIQEKNFFAVRAISQWHSFTMDVVESLLLEIFKMQLDRVLDNHIQASFPMEGWNR